MNESDIMTAIYLIGVVIAFIALVIKSYLSKPQPPSIANGYVNSGDGKFIGFIVLPIMWPFVASMIMVMVFLDFVWNWDR